MFATDSVLAYSLTDNDNALLSKVYTKLDALSQQKRDKVISQLETMVPTIKNDRIHELVIALIVKYDPNSAYAIMNALQNGSGSVSSTGTVDTWSIVKLNQPFTMWNIEYTILSIKMFDKVWRQNTFDDYHYPKNGKYLMVEFSYKNIAKDWEQYASWMMKIIDWENMFDTDIYWEVNGKVQMDWDSAFWSNDIWYIPVWIKKDVFVSFDVPASVLHNGVLYIEWDYSAGKLQTIKIPLKNLQ